MPAKIIDSRDPEALQLALSALKQQKIIALPTDTVYGFATSVSAEHALRQLYKIKKRPFSQPTALLVASGINLFPYVAEITRVAERLIESFWPGALTIIVKSNPRFYSLCQGKEKNSLGIRFPDHPFVEELINKLGVPLVATSANERDQEPASNAISLWGAFREHLGVIIEDQHFKPQPCSTVVDVRGSSFRIIRSGAITAEHIQSVLVSSRMPLPSTTPVQRNTQTRTFFPSTKTVSTIEAAIEQRRNYLEKNLQVQLKATRQVHFDIETAAKRHCENLIGATQIPLGIAGPLKVTLQTGKVENVFIPLATTEGALVASCNRGCSTISATQQGACTTVFSKTMTRAPVLTAGFSGLLKKTMTWIQKNFSTIKKIAEAREPFIKLIKIHPWLVGRNLFLRFEYDTGDAMGMNMVTFATDQAAQFICRHNQGVTLVALSGNLCIDKKASAVNFLLGRGFSVSAEVVLSAELVKQKLHTSIEALIDLNYRKNLLGSAVAHSLGYNAHYANIVAALFLATGQDPAHVVEGSMGITTMEKTDQGNLYVSVYLPNLNVGTVGGGTGLATQQEALALMKVDNKLTAGQNSTRFAQLVAGAVLAGELSLLGSLAEGTLSQAHRKLGRGEQSASN